MIKWRMAGVLVLAAGAMTGFEARAQVEENAAKVLQDSAAAIEKVSGVSYKSQLYGVGALKDIMDGEGEVKQLRVPVQPGRKAPAWIKGGVKELGKGKTPFTVSTDGAIIEWVDDSSSTHFKRSASDRADAQRILSLGSQVLLNEFTEATPYGKQLKAQKVELKPNEAVRGVDCQVVQVSWEGGLRSETWWIGVGDHLPRKVEMAHGQNRDLAKGTEIWEVKVLDKATVADLALKTPAGFHQDFQVVQAPPPKTPDINVNPNTPAQPIPPVPVVGPVPGSAAPSFDLKTSDGKATSLEQLKGKVTVLTFGGSRFPKTEGVNAVVADTIKGKEAQAYMLSCREESEAAAAEYAKKSPFPVLLGADAVRNDYKAVGFPFTVVLTADGRVAKSFQGVVTREKLTEAVDMAIRGEVAQPPAANAPVPAPVQAPTAQPQPQPLPNLNPTKK